MTLAEDAATNSKKAAASRPNIILIVADDLGYGHLGCYGQTKIRTPRLDQLAERGLRMTQFYAGAPVCASSRCVLMTGLHGGHTTVRGNTGGIPLQSEDQTVAEVLQSQNYATGIIGKWGLGEFGTAGVPYRQGFDEFFGYLHQIHAHFYYPETLWKNDQKYVLAGNAPGKEQTYAHDVIVDQALQFVRTHREDRFFLYLPFAVPHYELLVPEDSLAEYRGTFPETPYTGRGRKAGYPDDYGMQKTPKAALAGMITRMDRNIGKLIDTLTELNLSDSTLVLFSSDNGPSTGPAEPDFFHAAGELRGYKSSLYEGGIRVPLIAYWPDTIAPGQVSPHVATFADVLPTLAELTGATLPERCDGVSFVPTLVGEQVAGHVQHLPDYHYWEHRDGQSRAIRRGDWKAYRYSDETALELYDLSVDVSEQHDVAAHHPELVAEFTRLMNEAHTPAPPQIEPTKPPGRQYQ